MSTSLVFLILVIAAIISSIVAKLYPGKKFIKIAAIVAWVLVIALIVLVGFHLGSE